MDEVEEIKVRLGVAEVIGPYVQLKQSGRNLKAPCPFHSEKTASFMVSPEKSIWHCFGCGEGGDIFKFVMKIEGLDFRGALEKLARQAGVELKAGPQDQSAAKLRERLREAHSWAVKYYQASLMKNRAPLEYAVKQRKLNKASMADFQIGYAPDSWEGVTKFLRHKGFSESELLQAGLAARKRGIYDLFRGRVMLPIGDAEGRIIGFSGRVLGDEQPKYLNTPQTPLYDKSRAIYGLHLAKAAIREQDEVVLVEGNLDVVSSHQAGIRQVVAASGTALTLDQLKTLSRLTRNIKLAFDGDRAGLAATERAIELGQKLGLVLKMIRLPEGSKDPDELIQHDPKLWQRAIAEAVYIVDYLFERFEADFDLTTAMGKRSYTDRLALNLQRLADPVEQDHYIQLLASKTGTGLEAVRRKVEQAVPEVLGPKPELKSSDFQAGEKATVPKDYRTEIEELTVGLGLVFPDARQSLGGLSASDFFDSRLAIIYKAIMQSAEAKADNIIKGLQDDKDYAKILTLRGEEEYTSLSPADRSHEALRLARRLQNLSAQNLQGQITQKLEAARRSGDTGLEQALLKQFQAIINSNKD